MDIGSIPKATLGRIPAYIQYLTNLPDESDAYISATKIACGLSLGEIMVRKDLAMISGAGKPRIGYARQRLICDLEKHLGSQSLTNAVLVGVGKLGKALLDYAAFEEFGVKIIAGFDCNKNVLKISENKSVLPIDSIEQFCKENDVKIGIITVGQGSAQEVFDKLLSCGIRAIWNFAPCALDVPDGILMKQENLALSLAHLNSQIKNIK